jgi:hypothetical protein
MLLFCGCSTYGSVKSAFEREGYTESENIEAYQDKIYDALNAKSEEEVDKVCKVHLLVKDTIKVALILEFDSNDKMNEQINESETLKGLIKDAQKSDYVSGTCILLFYTPLTDGLNIFKSTK